MDAYEYTQKLKHLSLSLENVASIIAPDEISQKLAQIEKDQAQDDFWQDQKKAKESQKERTRLQALLKGYQDAKNALEYSQEMFDLAKTEQDDELTEQLFAECVDLENKFSALEVSVMLNGELDSNNAIISIHPGAGGTESADWALMLYRMYARWADLKGFKLELLDYQEGDEAGVKDVSFLISGENIYGYLKGENGVHRLVRISPFDSNSRRHTSFASVLVSPEIDDDIEILIEEKDLRIDTYRSSGAGGQHVNKTESAIRITHLPTNIVVQCQNDRSQHKNKAQAMKMLRSRLYELELEKQEAQKSGVEKSAIGWSHQIRSYVLAPYRQVKDTRVQEAFSNVDAILDGDIDSLIQAALVGSKAK